MNRDQFAKHCEVLLSAVSNKLSAYLNALPDDGLVCVHLAENVLLNLLADLVLESTSSHQSRKAYFEALGMKLARLETTLGEIVLFKADLRPKGKGKSKSKGIPKARAPLADGVH
jgi:hypothetical protein